MTTCMCLSCGVFLMSCVPSQWLREARDKQLAKDCEVFLVGTKKDMLVRGYNSCSRLKYNWPILIVTRIIIFFHLVTICLSFQNIPAHQSQRSYICLSSNCCLCSISLSTVLIKVVLTRVPFSKL